MKTSIIGLSVILVCLTLAAQDTHSPVGGLAGRFNRLDRNGDVKLTREEAGSAPFFEAAEKDGDGFLTFAEAEAHARQSAAPVRNRISGLEGDGAGPMTLRVKPAEIPKAESPIQTEVRAFLDKEMPSDDELPNAVKQPTWVTQPVRAHRVEFRTFESRTAKSRVSFHIYTPEAYDREKERRFPVVYWLHGSGGGLGGIPRLARDFDSAITFGTAPPFLVVFVNGLVEGMYVDWKDGSVPLETVIVKDLVPHIDATWRTIATREGRMLDGFSMGGYGAARLGFKYPELFRAVSIVGAGPMQPELVQAPRAGRQRAAEVLRKVYGDDQAYFRGVSPRTLAEQNAEAIAKSSLVRIVIGDKDETFENNRAFHEHLERLKIPHAWTVLPGVAHDPMGVRNALGDDNWAFYRAAFNPVDSPPLRGAATTDAPVDRFRQLDTPWIWKGTIEEKP